jgi:hypothetical protein
VITRTVVGRSLAVALSLSISQLAAPAAQAAEAAHLVTGPVMASRLADRAAQRAAEIELVQQTLDSGAAQGQAKALGFDPARLRAAVPHLSDSELQELSRRAAAVKDVAAGHGSDEGLVLLAIALLVVGVAILIAASSNGYDGCGCY